MTLTLKLGSDPEGFIRNKKTGEFVSAGGIIPGTKKEPFKVPCGAIQVDGVAAEYNIDPATTAEEFDRNHQMVQDELLRIIQKKNPDLELVFVAAANFDEKYFLSLPETSRILGCDPDFSCLDGRVIKKKHDITNTPIRTAAGHMHIGFSENEDVASPYHIEDCRFIAEVFYKKGNFTNNLRRYDTKEETLRLKYYGMLGAFRPKSYGVELRQFSNHWVRTSQTRRQMFEYISKSILQLEHK